MNLVISKCVTADKVSNFTGHYLPNSSTVDIGVLGFFGIVQHKEHPPDVWSIPPVQPCILTQVRIDLMLNNMRSTSILTQVRIDVMLNNTHSTYILIQVRITVMINNIRCT